jgi:hypothetical protein
VPANEEWIVLIDKLNQLEIITREISTATNFSGQYVASQEELNQFAKEALFPSHALILRDSEGGVREIIKGLLDPNLLYKEFKRMLNSYGRVFVETDMRGMHNPTRMQVIESVTNKLVEKINCCCPSCHTPGFDIVQVITGLPCGTCTSPTRSVKTLIYGCSKCAFEQLIDYPDNKEMEDPMYCDYCNP